MSQPKRFSVAVDDPWFGDGAYITEDGKYVLWEDYAALAAENERLRSASFVTAIPSEHYERVIKAGDEMMEVLESEIPFTAMNAVNGWLAAKEGRDAK